MNRVFKLVFFIPVTIFFGCENLYNNDTDPLTEMNVFVLCEGNFGQSNASLWMLNPEKPEISGPIYQNQTGQSLGDICQSMTVDNDRLFVVNNNSHSIEEFSLGGEQIIHVKKIGLAGASPRHMAVYKNKGYITAWNVNGIIVMNLKTYAIEDTIPVNGLPEMIIFYEDYLYTSITMKPDWTADNRVLKIYNDGTLSKTFEVVKGPGNMVIHDKKLYVASTYYNPDWSTTVGNSLIDLVTGKVDKNDLGKTSDYGADILAFNNTVYRSFKTGIAPLNPNLSADVNSIIGKTSSTYSAAAFGEFLFLADTDYQAPDNVYVYDNKGTLVHQYQVGAIPGSFAVFEKEVD
ncbi:MAG: hypothetical protein HOA15_05545 [Candidatus Marinimicrobia bacterium]|jgi:hypothetical protein|nr:hypothetical protein [Candidatus Neomarinimicrobiota bacterium]MBT3675335.1 hypothetical protein [Candidatus Neomarinimicrobiota bacterium]MBT3763163.1 hypothetical protein [Candidatus Neomarinimicrobiota bacterium]MBT4068917.1 hypothetical protein [Candidatus Neomarinimicrobiota bacterium]MBT4270810.1 hypothetical protein [Candidatus Neomarinimicrobiota bacterium]